MTSMPEHSASLRTLITRERIAGRIEQMGSELTADLRAAGARDEDPASRVVLVPILTGALVFTADLIRHVPMKMAIRPITASSYPGKATTSQGVTIAGMSAKGGSALGSDSSGFPTDLAGAHVVIVDDILDSGRTLGLVRRLIAAQRPASLRIAVLLSKTKPAGRDEDVTAEHVGFTIDDEFVVGYGLDYDGYYRNLPEIAVLRV